MSVLSGSRRSPACEKKITKIYPGRDGQQEEPRTYGCVFWNNDLQGVVEILYCNTTMLRFQSESWIAVLMTKLVGSHWVLC